MGNVEAPRYELEEAAPADPGVFKARYLGTDASSVRTGMEAGVHHFRVRAIAADGEAGPWSETLAVEVTYMEERRLSLLVALGGVVVLATILSILHGHFTHKRREESA